MEQARKEGEEKENERNEADREEEIKLELLDAALKQVMRLTGRRRSSLSCWMQP